MTLYSPKSLGKLAVHFTSMIMRTLSIKFRIEDPDYYWGSDKPAIYVIWHGRMFIPLHLFSGKGIYMLVSEHRDGEIVTSSIENIGYKTVRGSTTRGGAKALIKLIKLAREGNRMGITVDGPKGPKWHFQTGAVYIAAKTGLPLIPVSASAKKAFHFKSWDTFQLPLPFSKAVVLINKPYYVTGGTDDENIERHRETLEKILTDLVLEADKIVESEII